MGYLLKEALKTLCGVNQWAYAVFWKLGCQNPRLLIWEECYFESASCSGLPGLSGLSGYESYNTNLDSLGTSDLQSSVETPDKVHLLVDKMMVGNHVNIVGEGLVGRVAFTGHHQWILSENYYREAHPPEVLKEVCPQFSVGMQTVAVIPVLPHGVVQFGSFSTIIENLGFVNGVTSLVSSVLLPKDVAANELAPKIGVPVCLGNSAAGGLSLKLNVINPPGSFDSFNYVGNSCQTTMADSQTSFSLAREFQNELQTNGAASQASNSAPSNFWPLQCHQEAKTTLPVKLDSSTSNQLVNAVAKAEVIPLNSEMWMKEGAFVYTPRSTLDVPPSCSSTLNHSNGTIRCTEQKMISDSGNQGYFNTPNLSTGSLMPAARTDSDLISCSNGGSTTYMSVESHGLIKGARSNTKTISSMDSVSDVKWAANRNITPGHPANSDLQNVNFTIEACNSDSIDHLTAKSSLSYSSSSKHLHMEQNTIQALDIPVSQFNEHLNMGAFVPGIVEDDNKHKFGGHIPSVNNTIYEDSYVQAESGSDLFDVFGPDFKNTLLGSYWNSGSSNQSAPTKLYSDNDNLLSKKGLVCSEIYSTKGNSNSGIFSSAGTDNLLEAVVSRVHPSATCSMDDKVSCRTTLTDMSSSSLTNTSLPYGRFGVSDHMKGELFGVPKYLAGVGVMSSSFSKEESGACSQGSSIYGSQISSWLEKDQKAKPSNSVSTGYSKKPEETGKSNRRRLKLGENPRPRPKDRQMIQDRVKELREIVPNGAKCSIDALLERTIKHMLFLQSVMKHADKLKETGESKIVSKDGGLLLKDNFEGGATWAYEVGSQSMVCPIIVEDLNRPHQMLVEMLCEERGWFLEIADIIRGLGLTILKGVMEARNEKIWARFAVEANRDVTRMQIFISLVHFLEQSAKGGVAQQNGISSQNPMAAQQCHHAASVPITGRST